MPCTLNEGLEERDKDSELGRALLKHGLKAVCGFLVFAKLSVNIGEHILGEPSLASHLHFTFFVRLKGIVERSAGGVVATGIVVALTQPNVRLVVIWTNAKGSKEGHDRLLILLLVHLHYTEGRIRPAQALSLRTGRWPRSARIDDALRDDLDNLPLTAIGK